MLKTGQFFKIKNKQNREPICLKLYNSNIVIFIRLNDVVIGNEICSISDNVFDFQIIEYNVDFCNNDLDDISKIKLYIERKASEFYEFEHIPLDKLHYIFNGRLVKMFNNDEISKSTESDKKYIYDAKKNKVKLNSTEFTYDELVDIVDELTVMKYLDKIKIERM